MNDDSKEKRALGELWEKGSNGKCLFLFTEKSMDGLDVSAQLERKSRYSNSVPLWRQSLLFNHKTFELLHRLDLVLFCRMCTVAPFEYVSVPIRQPASPNQLLTWPPAPILPEMISAEIDNAKEEMKQE